MEGYVLEHPFIRNIAEPYVAEFYFPPDLVKLDSIGSIHYLGLNIHNGEYLFGGSKCGLQPVELLGKVLNGVKELRDVHVEGYYDAARERLPEEYGIIEVAFASEVQKQCY